MRTNASGPYAANVAFDLAGQVGRAVTLTVPSSVHYSGNRTGTVLAVAHMSGRDPADLTNVYVVLDAECRTVLIPVDAIMSWEPQR
jgi:hypothetical protein